MKLRPAILLLTLLATAAASCGMDFDPPSYLDDLRVLAIEADPLEVGPGETVTLKPRVYVPAGQTIAGQTWSFCPFHLGPQAGYACALPACVVDLPPDAAGATSADPLSLAADCLAEQGQGGQGALPDEIPDRVEVLFTYQLTASGGASQRVVMPLPVYLEGAPENRNHPPIIEAVLFDGQEAREGVSLGAVPEDGEVALEIRVDPASQEPYVDESGRDLTEDTILSLYATAGRFEFDRLDQNDPRTVWTAKELQEGQDQALFYVVARDLRGGQTVAGPFTLGIER